MRKSLLLGLTLAPVVALSGCSFLNQSQGQRAHHAGFGQYNGCVSAPCTAPQGAQIQTRGHHQPYAQGPQGYGQFAPQGHTQGIPQSVALNAAQARQGRHAPQGYHGQHAPQLRGAAHHGAKRAGQVYGNIGVVKYENDRDNYGLIGRLGYDSGRIFGAELEGSIGLLDEKETIGAFDVNYGYDYNLAAFAVARVPVGQRLSLHARGGYDIRSFTAAATDGVGDAAKAKENLDGFAYGLGGEYALSPRDGLRLDYTLYESKGRDADTLSATYVRKF